MWTSVRELEEGAPVVLAQLQVRCRLEQQVRWPQGPRQR